MSPAYRIAENDIKNILGKDFGKPRFTFSKNMSFNDMQTQLKYVNKFNSFASSTVTGMKRVVKKRNKTMAKKYGDTHLTALYRILSSDEFKKTTELIPASDQIAKHVAVALNKGISENDIRGKLQELTEQENDGYLLDELEDMLDSLV